MCIVLTKEVYVKIAPNHYSSSHLSLFNNTYILLTIFQPVGKYELTPLNIMKWGLFVPLFYFLHAQDIETQTSRGPKAHENGGPQI